MINYSLEWEQLTQQGRHFRDKNVVSQGQEANDCVAPGSLNTRVVTVAVRVGGRVQVGSLRRSPTQYYHVLCACLTN